MVNAVFRAIKHALSPTAILILSLISSCQIQDAQSYCKRGNDPAVAGGRNAEINDICFVPFAFQLRTGRQIDPDLLNSQLAVCAAVIIRYSECGKRSKFPYRFNLQ